MIETDSYTIAVHAHDGPYENFLYLLTDKATGLSAAIDPAWDAALYGQMASESAGEISAIWLTHSHFDHVNAVEALRQDRELPLHISQPEAEFWSDTPADALIFSDGDTLQIGETRARVLITPGHTPGSSCFLLDEHLIAGDTLFTWGCGRCDLKGGSAAQMFSSLGRLAKDIPGHAVILPGHNYGDRASASMTEQLSGNPFLHCKTVETFTNYRMELHDKTRESPYGPMSAAELPY